MGLQDPTLLNQASFPLRLPLSERHHKVLFPRFLFVSGTLPKCLFLLLSLRLGTLVNALITLASFS